MTCETIKGDGLTVTVCSRGGRTRKGVKPPVVGVRGANAQFNNKAGANRTRKGVPLYGLFASQRRAAPAVAIALILAADAPHPRPLPGHFLHGEMACIRCGHATETGIVTETSITGLHDGGCWAAYVAGSPLA